MSPPDSKAAAVAARFAWMETVSLDKRANGTPMRLVVIMSALIGTEGYAWAGRETLAKLAGIDKSNVKDALLKLVDLGYLRIERNAKTGRGQTDRFWPVGVSGASPVWARYRSLKDNGGRADPPSETVTAATAHPERGVDSPERGVDRPAKGGPSAPRLLEHTPTKETGSDPNGSGARKLAPGSSRIWKGSEGDPLPPDFPDAEAMSSARWDMESGGVGLDLEAERRAFRSHHCAVRCLQRDWNRSWEIWIDKAITREQAA